MHFVRSLNPVAECFGVRERGAHVLAKQHRVIERRRRSVKKAGQLSDLIVPQDLGRILVQESRGSEEIELFVAIELQDGTNAVQNFPADTALARFQPAERAVVDLREIRKLLLGQAAFVSEARQDTA